MLTRRGLERTSLNKRRTLKVPPMLEARPWWIRPLFRRSSSPRQPKGWIFLVSPTLWRRTSRRAFLQRLLAGRHRRMTRRSLPKRTPRREAQGWSCLAHRHQGKTFSLVVLCCLNVYIVYIVPVNKPLSFFPYPKTTDTLVMVSLHNLGSSNVPSWYRN